MSEKQNDNDVTKDLFSVIKMLVNIMLLLIGIIVALPLGYYLFNLPERPKVKLEDTAAVLTEVKSVVQEFWIAR